MKETINVNIGSLAFILDRDAYEVLKAYLDDIESRLPQEDHETMADIESRIAEIFTEKKKSSLQVINLKMVEEAKAQMGDANYFGEAHYTQHEEAYDTPNEHRLERPRNDRVLAGVCSGIAKYFKLDISLIRLLTLLLILFGGLSIWIYIILWIVIPEEKIKFEL